VRTRYACACVCGSVRAGVAGALYATCGPYAHRRLADIFVCQLCNQAISKRLQIHPEHADIALNNDLDGAIARSTVSASSKQMLCGRVRRADVPLILRRYPWRA
jgi:hypothetical protein